MSFTITTRWTPETTQEDWREFRATLAQEEGYTDGAPRGAADVDQPIVELCDCPTCGKGMRYFPMIKPGSYRAFAVCLACNLASEF